MEWHANLFEFGEVAGRSGAAPAGIGIRMGFPVGRPVVVRAEGEPTESESRVLRFTLSTENVVRDNATVRSSGWTLANFRANPVVLWAHDYRQPPIARSPLIEIGQASLIGDADFVPAEVSAFAEMIFQMYKRGFMHAVSVGFEPLEWTFDEKRGGFNFLTQDLLEFSAVPVPADPGALLQARSAGVDLAPMREWATAVMDGIEPGMWLPRAAAEMALRVIAAPQVPVAVVVEASTTNGTNGTEGTVQVSATAPAPPVEVEPTAAPPVFELIEGEEIAFDFDEEETVDVTPEEIKALIAEAIGTRLAPVMAQGIERAVREQIGALTGRVD